jgi:hypothetical protein
MEPAPTRPRHEAIDDDDLRVHEWRVAQLTRLGVPWLLAGPPPTRLTGTRSPSWYTAAARHGSHFRSFGEAVPWPATFPSTW